MTEWDASEKGRRVYEMCKEVGRNRLPLTFKGAQLLTGHGNLRGYLHKYRLRAERDECECGKGEEKGMQVTDKCGKSALISLEEGVR